jgi:hypothetical protein
VYLHLAADLRLFIGHRVGMLLEGVEPCSSWKLVFYLDFVCSFSSSAVASNEGSQVRRARENLGKGDSARRRMGAATPFISLQARWLAISVTHTRARNLDKRIRRNIRFLFLEVVKSRR